MTPENSESKSTTRNTKSSTSVKVGPVRELLRLKNMRFDDDRARGDAAAFVFGESIVNSRRDSPDRPQSDQGLAGLMRKYSQDNEATLMHKWFHPLVKDDRMPNERLAYQEAAVMDRDEDMERFEDAEESRQILDPNGVWRFFQADGLESSWDKEFHRGSIPKLDHPNKKDLAKLLEVLPRIVNPKPDITYGYDNNFFTDVQRALNLRLISTAKISSAINWPFLNVDAKLSDILAAVNQCNRSGSGVVCSVWRVCDEYDITIPDIDDVSTVFTLAITTGSAYIHVHWAELEHGVRVYHMKTVAGFALGMEKAHMDLRKAINSILDWGLLRRKPKIDQLLDAILAKEKEKKSGERGATAP